MHKIIVKRLSKICAVCGKVAHVKVYSDRSYRGGHYFSRDKLLKNNKMIFAEYWECPKCH